MKRDLTGNNWIPSIIICCLWIGLSFNSVYGQPYFDTYVPNRYVAENSFLGRTVDRSIPPGFTEVKDKLPSPHWPDRPDVVEFYWRTWELAFNNLHQVSGDNGFITPYIDPAFNGNIFTEDCGFMLLFCRYGFRAFNFQQTLDNFYTKQHKDGFICREIIGTTGKDAFQRFDPSSAGINIFPWTEWNYFSNVNDIVRLQSVFPVLLANYQWYSVYRSWPDGTYYSSGWGCGMDNQPRLPKGFNPAFSHGHMSWIDATLQQIFAAKILIQMADILDRSGDVIELQNEITHLSAYVNEKMWDSGAGVYVDRFRDGSLSDVKSIGTYWALLADVVPSSRLSGFLTHLSDTAEFNRQHRIPSLSADHPDFDPEGGYWLGAVWAMTNYMVLQGLTKVGADALAHEIAQNHLDNAVKVYGATGIIWENYSSEYLHGSGRENFVGEGGLTGTAILIENIFGIRTEAYNNTLVWDVRLLDEHGLSNFPFGKDGVVKLLCKKRTKQSDKPVVEISSNVPLKVKLIWEGGEEIIYVG